jgi:hypothetical protein
MVYVSFAGKRTNGVRFLCGLTVIVAQSIGLCAMATSQKRGDEEGMQNPLMAGNSAKEWKRRCLSTGQVQATGLAVSSLRSTPMQFCFKASVKLEVVVWELDLLD